MFGQVHDVEFAPSLDIVLNETLPTVKEAQSQGKARFIGVTGYPVSVLADCIKRSSVKIDMVLCYTRLSMLNQTVKEYLPLFKVNFVFLSNLESVLFYIVHRTAGVINLNKFYK